MPNPWQNRIVSSGVKPASDFLAHELNWKIHSRTQQDGIEGSLDHVGWYKSVVESARTGKLLDGHARIILALRRGDDTPVPYEVVDVSEEEEAIILATLDPLAALAVADKEKLDALLREMPAAMDPRLQEMMAGLARKEGLYGKPANDANSEWQGMPEFEQDTIGPKYTIKVHFGSGEDISAFSRLLGQTVNEKTRYIWFPRQQKERLKDYLAHDES